MNLLLDTHALIWWLAGDKALSAKARKAMADEDNAIFVSAGNDGRGAVRDIVRIANGCRWQQKAEALIVRGGAQAEPGNMAGGALDDTDIARCEELGEAMAQGLALGLF